MNWILIVILAAAGFLLIRYGKGLLAAIGKLLKDNYATLAATIIALIIAIVIIVAIQPQALIGSNGVFGSMLKSSKADANLRQAALDPRDDPAVWENQVAKYAAEAVGSEYQLASAKNKAAMAAAEAEKDCYNGDQAACERSVPAGVQASTRAVAKTTGEVSKNAGNALAKVDLTTADESLSQPVGSAPTEAERWVKSMYDLPKGAALFAGLLSMMVILGLSIRLVRR